MERERGFAGRDLDDASFPGLCLRIGGPRRRNYIGQSQAAHHLDRPGISAGQR